MNDQQAWYKNLYHTLLEDIKKAFNGKDVKKSMPKKDFAVFKDNDGNYRWFGWVTNKFKDRDGDILTDSAHIEFYNFLNANPEYAPELWTWHTPGTARKMKADWWEYANGFFMYSGILNEDEADAFLNSDNDDVEVGMSHGFYVLEKVGNYILKYRTFEVSELPLEKAANPFTNFTVKEDLKKMFSVSKRAYLVSRFGEEATAKLEQDTENKEAVLTELGVNWKEVNEQYELEIEAKLAERVADASKGTVKAIMSQVVEALNIPGLQETLKALNDKVDEAASLAVRVGEIEASIKHLLETEDERIAKAITPAEPFSWDLRPTKKEAVNVADLTDEIREEVEKASGKFDWLSNMSPLGGQ